MSLLCVSVTRIDGSADAAQERQNKTGKAFEEVGAGYFDAMQKARKRVAFA